MTTNLYEQKILILDFGSQYTSLLPEQERNLSQEEVNKNIADVMA